MRQAETGKELLACGAQITWLLEGSMTPPSAIPMMLFRLACDHGIGAATDDLPTIE